MTGKILVKGPNGEKDATGEFFDDNNEETAAGRPYKHGLMFEGEAFGFKLNVHRILDDIQIELELIAPTNKGV